PPASAPERARIGDKDLDDAAGLRAIDERACRGRQLDANVAHQRGWNCEHDALRDEHLVGRRALRERAIRHLNALAGAADMHAYAVIGLLDRLDRRCQPNVEPAREPCGELLRAVREVAFASALRQLALRRKATGHAHALEV